MVVVKSMLEMKLTIEDTGSGHFCVVEILCAISFIVDLIYFFSKFLQPRCMWILKRSCHRHCVKASKVLFPKLICFSQISEMRCRLKNADELDNEVQREISKTKEEILHLERETSTEASRLACRLRSAYDKVIDVHY